MLKPGIDFIGSTTPFYCTDGAGNFLLHKRSINCADEHGCWDLGSGKVEWREDLITSMLREVREEYGCAGVVLEQIPAHSIVRQFSGVWTHWVAAPFIVLVNRAEAYRKEEHKMDDIGWFTLDKLPTPLHAGAKQTMARLDMQRLLDRYQQPIDSDALAKLKLAANVLEREKYLAEKSAGVL